jgi:2-polyprenyl-3-methyl-5-hydroxy-6-metoxy-1,4-benzoquinol methylase
MTKYKKDKDKLSPNQQINQIKVNTKALKAPKKLEIGTKTSANFFRDPKWILFTLSRYKFVSKMLIGKKNVLEVGCGDGFGASIVKQSIENLTCVELDERMIIESKKIHPFKSKIKFVKHDFIVGPIKLIKYDACYCLDVLEHIDLINESLFIGNICKSLHEKSVGIFGMPSLESQVYASQISKEGHVNCKSAEQLKVLMNSFFETVFIFSMNDEVLHTGYHPMSQYLIALCSHPKKL